jgi:hypothetical protein
VFTGRASLGTMSTPLTLTNGTIITQLNAHGYDGTSWSSIASGSFRVYAEGTWSNTSHPTETCESTTLSGTTTLSDVLCSHNDGGVTVGAVASQGSGTLNIAGLLYANGTAPTGTGGYARAVSAALTTPTLSTPTLTTPVINGLSSGTGVSVATFSNTLLLRDASGNAYANNSFYGTTPTASAGGTTTLSVSSTRIQQLTGTLAQTFKLPDATTLPVGGSYEFDNNSTGLLTIVDNASGAVKTVPAGGYARSTVTNIGSAAGTWDTHFMLPANVQWGTASALLPSYIVTTSAASPASVASQTVMSGQLSGTATLTATGQAWYYGTAANGAVIQGDGTNSDVMFANKSGSNVFFIPTGTTKLNFPSLSSGTCSSAIGLDSGNNTITIACPGASASIQVGTTTITSGTTNNILFNNAGTLGNAPATSFVTVGNGLSLTGTTTVNITQNAPNFLVRMNASQSVTSGSPAKSNFDTSVIDSNSYWSAANHNYLPLQAGNYQFCTSLVVTGTLVAGTSNLGVYISKGGTIGGTGVSVGSTLVFASTTGSMAAGFCVEAAMNGSTDTMEVDVNASGTSPFILGASATPDNFRTTFSGHRLSN